MKVGFEQYRITSEKVNISLAVVYAALRIGYEILKMKNDNTKLI